jgi:perosamine synthetase
MPQYGPLALDGGEPVRTEMLPYARQTIDDQDVAAVVAALRSDWLTTGPLVEEFEEAFAREVGAAHAVAVSSGTAALHLAVAALEIGSGDEVIVPAMTFASTANCVVFQGGTPVFSDVDSETLLIDPDQVEKLLTPKTRAVITVDYAGQPSGYDKLREITDARGMPLIADACHALGARHRGRRVGSLADVSTFSFHPAKHISTGEGGMLVTDSEEIARHARILRNHGITSDLHERAERGSWHYEMVDLGFNYRLTDLQCALGLKQLEKAGIWLDRRREIASAYRNRLAEIRGVEPLSTAPDIDHAYHLFVIRFSDRQLAAQRAEIFTAFRAEGIGVNVHYIPVHLHPFYKSRFGFDPGLCPRAEEEYRRILSLPMFPAMTDRDVEDVLTATGKIVTSFAEK